MNKYLEFMLFENETEILGLPDGVVFIDDKMEKIYNEVENFAIEIFKKNNYKKVIPPVFEYYETFENGSGYNIARKSFSFKDKDGKLLSLRYDMTTPIARMVSMKSELFKFPVKFYYIGDVFREQPLHKGRLRQLRQIGIEYIGKNNFNSDIEILNILGEILYFVDKNYKIVIGNILPYKFLVSKLNLTKNKEEALHIAFHRKDLSSIKIILDNNYHNKEIIDNLILLLDFYGSIDTIKNKIKFLKYEECLNPVIYLLEIIEKLNPKIKQNIIIDLGLIKDFSYYTSLTIEGYINSLGFAIANGGRYDNLLKSFGKDYPAIGFAIDIGYII